MADEPDPFALEVKQEQDAQRLQKSLAGAIDTVPDRQADLNKLSQKTGVPTFSLASPENEAWVKNQARIKDLNPQDLVTKYPMTAGALKDENFSKIAHDDVENLKALEDSFAVVGKTHSSTLDDMLAMTEKQAAYAGYLMLAYGPEGQDVDAMAGFIASRNKPLAEAQANAPGYMKDFQKRFQDADGMLEGAGVIMSSPRAIGRTVLGQVPNSLFPAVTAKAGAVGGAGAGAAIGANIALSAGQAGPQVATPEEIVTVPTAAAGGAVVGGIIGGASGGFAGGSLVEIAAWIDQSLAEKNIDVTDQGQIAAAFRDPEFMAGVKAQAEAKGLTTAGIDALWNATFAGRFAKALVPLKNAKTLASNAGKIAADVAVGAVGEGVSEAGGQLAATGEIDAKDALLEGFSSLGQSVFDTSLYSGVRRADVDQAAKAVANQKLQEVETVHNAAMAAKTIQRDPAAVRAMVEAANPDAKVYVDGQVAVTYFQELDPETKANLLQAIPDIEERIQESAASGADVMLNRSDYVAYIASTEGGRVLMEHVKFDRVDDLTAAQLQNPDFLNDLYEDAAPTADDAAQDEITQFQERISQEMLDAGRIGSRDLARASTAPLASFVRTMKERGGSQAVTESLVNGLEVEGPVAVSRQFLDVSDKQINDMREYADRIKTLSAGQEKALETRRAKALEKSQKTGQPYQEPRANRTKGQFLPVLSYISKMGGVKTGSRLAGELKAMDLTPKTAPWLFTKEGRKITTFQGVRTIEPFSDVDTLDVTGLQEHLGNEAYVKAGASSENDTTGYYVDSAWVLEAISNELAGRPIVAAPVDNDAVSFDYFLQHLDYLELNLENATNEQIKEALAKPVEFQDDVDETEPDDEGRTFNQNESLKELVDRLVSAQDDPGTRLGSSGVKFDVSESGNIITVDRIFVPAEMRDKGIATGMMKSLIQYADRTGQKIALSASSDFGGNLVKLKKFYKSLGFVENKGKNKDFTTKENLIREPEARTFNQAAYHGTPHKFDKFTIEHIGSGEGNQAFGYGLYFASNKAVAEFYRTALSGRDRLTNSKGMRYEAKTDEESEALAYLSPYMEFGKSIDEPIDKLTAELKKLKLTNKLSFGDTKQKELRRINRLEKNLKVWKKIKAEGYEFNDNKGQVYEVSLPEDDVLLDWDKPLSQQPESVRSALAGMNLPAMTMKPFKGVTGGNNFETDNGDLIIEDQDEGGYVVHGDNFKVIARGKTPEDVLAQLQDIGPVGSTIYSQLTTRAARERSSLEDKFGDDVWGRADKLASMMLNEAGVKGIKYLDGNSRTRGAGSSNFVIFDDTAIETLKTYYQANRGQVSMLRDGRYVIKLFETSNLSTFLHETGHVLLDGFNRYATADGAPQQIKDDMQAVFDYLEVKDYAGIQTEQHEKFARAFENYLRSGDAPSVGLQSVFRQFKAWLTRIYKTVQELRAPVTPELKAVFDRLLATDEEINQVAQGEGFKLDDGVLSILNKDEKERYQKLHDKALEQAKERLLAKTMRQKERETTQAWRDERKAVRADMELQVNSDPVYRSIQFLTKGVFLPGDDALPPPPIKINRKDAEAVLGKTIMKRLPRAMFSKDGIAADNISEVMGYTVGNGAEGYRPASGSELLWAMVNAEGRQDRIERLTNEEMVKRHGDLLVDGTIEQVALETFTSDAQAMKLEMEGKVAAKLAGLPFGTNTNFELAAQKILGSKKIQEAANSDRFYRASVRAARTYGRAIKGKDYAAAVKAKQQQLLSHHLYKQSLQARRVMEKSMDSWKRLTKPDEKLVKSVQNLNYVYVARAILGRYGVLPYNPGNLQSYFLNIQRDDPEAYEDLLLAVQENTQDIPEAVSKDVTYTQGKLAGRTITQTSQPWTKLSLDEFRGLKDVIDNVLGVGKRQKEILIDGQKMDIAQVQAELEDRIRDLPSTSISDGQQEALKWHDQGKLALSGIKAGMRRVESWAEAMDGRYGGVFRKYVWNPINDARGQYLVARHEYLDKMVDLLKPHDDRLNGSGKIVGHEIGYTFHSKAELVGMLLHTGNESNYFKLWKGGRGKKPWNPANLQAMLDRMNADGTLTKEDWDLVQGMWDLVETLKPQAQKMHREMYGYYFSEVTSWPITTPFGDYKGGYWPAIPDNTLSQDARIRTDKENLISVNNSSMFPSTGRGFTKARVDGYAAPLQFDLKLLPSHVDKVLRFVHLEPAVKDVAKLVNDKSFRAALDRVDPRAAEDMLVPWLQRAARQTVETQDSKWFKYVDPAARFLRSSASAQAMMLNFTNAIQQITGFAPAIYKVGARPFATAFVTYMKNPRKAHETMSASSEFMRYRSTILADNLQKNVLDIVLDRSKFAKVRDAAQAHGYIFQQVMQSWVDGTTWMAAYDKATAEGKADNEAVRYADSIIRETQGSTSAEDISKFEAGPATMRLFTMFYSYFNTQGNLILTEVQNIRKNTSSKEMGLKFTYLYLMCYAVPSFMAEFLVKALKGDLPDDEDDDGIVIDDYMAWFVGSQFRYGTAMIPWLGQVANGVANAFDEKPYNDRLTLSPVISTAETLAKTPKSIYDAVAEDGDVSRAVQNFMTSAGFLTGLPLGQLGKPLGYGADLAEGDTEIDSPIDPIRGILTGPPPADKR